MAKIGIVTVLYNSASVLEDYFNTLSEQTFKDFVLYVIDNKSPDDSLAMSYKYAELYKDCYKTVIIENDKNYGIAKGNNQGIIRSLADGCDYVLLSNNDVVFKKDTIALMLNGITKCNVGLVVPKIFFYDTNLIWAAGGFFKYLSGGTNHIGYAKEDNGQYEQIKEVSYAPTCVMLIDKKVFHEVGLMDEDYFVYYDDTDFIYRTHRAKIKLLYLPEPVVYHKESFCTGGMKSDFSLRYNARNAVYFALKNFSIFHCVIVAINYFLYYWAVRRHSVEVRQRQIIIDGYKEGFQLYKKRIRK